MVSETNPLLKDNAHGLFRLWFLLVDGEFEDKSFHSPRLSIFFQTGLCSCISTCGRGYQSSAIDGLFAILSSFSHQNPGEEDFLAEFGLFVTNHVLLPMLQNWLRRCGHSVHVKALKFIHY